MSGLHGNFDERVVLDTGAMDWAESPAGGVWRKRLDHVGPAESGRVTSLVKFEAGTRFPAHGHPDGEEIFVLDGEFRDENGAYPAGYWLMNPDGHEHEPWAEKETLVFVKLRQYPGRDRPRVALDTNAMEWEETKIDGLLAKKLYTQNGYPERVYLRKMLPGCQGPLHAHRAGEEVFVIEGELCDEQGRYPAGTWLRNPPGSRHAPYSETGCVFWVKDDHLDGL